MTKQSPNGRYLVISDHHLQEQGSANVVPAGRYESLEDAIEHAESVTYKMGVMDSKAESRGFIYTNWGRKLPPKKYVPIQTPWGPSQSQREHAPGIIFYSTASHGGFRLSEERQAELHEVEVLKDFGPWLEEDCEACLVFLRWPGNATDEQIADAITMVKVVSCWDGCTRWKPVAEWLATTMLHERAAKHQEAVKDLWRRGSMSTSGQSWLVYFSRGGHRREVRMADYPEKRYYTDAELDALNQSVQAPKKRSPFPDHCFMGNSYDFEPSDADPGL